MNLNVSQAAGFEKTFDKYPIIKNQLKIKLREFILWKMENPSNGSGGGIEGFGKKDYKFTPLGPYGKNNKNISHAHFTDDVSIVYKIIDNHLYVYGLFTHKDLGTTNSPNIRLQQSMSMRFKNANFEPYNSDSSDNSKEDSSTIEVPDSQKNDKKNRTTVNPQYSPRTKQPTQQQSRREKLLSFVKIADSIWPQRQLLNSILKASDDNAIKEIIKREALNLHQLIKNRTANNIHLQYYESLKSIAEFLGN